MQWNNRRAKEASLARLSSISSELKLTEEAYRTWSQH